MARVMEIALSILNVLKKNRGIFLPKSGLAAKKNEGEKNLNCPRVKESWS